MTSKEEFRAFGHAMIDYIIDYHENIKERPVLPKGTSPNVEYTASSRAKILRDNTWVCKKLTCLSNPKIS